jgi:hypothetical protein
MFWKAVSFGLQRHFIDYHLYSTGMNVIQISKRGKNYYFADIQLNVLIPLSSKNIHTFLYCGLCTVWNIPATPKTFLQFMYTYLA